VINNVFYHTVAGIRSNVQQFMDEIMSLECLYDHQQPTREKAEAAKRRNGPQFPDAGQAYAYKLPEKSTIPANRSQPAVTISEALSSWLERRLSSSSPRLQSSRSFNMALRAFAARCII